MAIGVASSATRIFSFDKALVRQSKDFVERLQAANTVDIDGYELAEALNSKRGSRSLTPEFRAKSTTVLKNNVKYVRYFHSKLVSQSRRLFAGLHWWMRGRYGRGSAGNGFMTSAAALSNPQAMFALYMPVKTPKVEALNSYRQGGEPGIRRRHHHLWEYGGRRVHHSIDRSSREHIADRSKIRSSSFFWYSSLSFLSTKFTSLTLTSLSSPLKM